MKQRIIESVLLTLMLAMISSFVLVMMSFLGFGESSDMNYNQFFSKNVKQISVNVGSSGRAVTPDLFSETLGNNYTLVRSLGLDENRDRDSVRAVYSRGEAFVPQITSGRYFTQEEFEDEDAFVAVVGSLVAERSVRTDDDGKEYYSYLGQDYEVIGHISTGKASDLDNTVMLNLRAFIKDMPVFATYYIDAKYEYDVAAVSIAFVNLFEEYSAENLCTVQEVYTENTSIFDIGETTWIFTLAFILLAVNTVISCYQFVDKRRYEAAVKKLCGFSSGRVCAEIMARFAVMATTGFVIGVLIKKPLIETVLKLMDSTAALPEYYDSLFAAYIAVLVFTFIIVFPVARSVYRTDTSAYLKTKE